MNGDSEPLTRLNCIAVLSRIREVCVKLVLGYLGPEQEFSIESMDDFNEYMPQLHADISAMELVVLGQLQLREEIPLDGRIAVDSVLRLKIHLLAFVHEFNQTKRYLRDLEQDVSDFENIKKELFLDLDVYYKAMAIAFVAVISATQYPAILDYKPKPNS